MSDDTVLEDILRRVEGMQLPVTLFVRPDRVADIRALVEGTGLSVRSSSLITDDRIFIFNEAEALRGFRWTE